jgi:hypothetical protein
MENLGLLFLLYGKIVVKLLTITFACRSTCSLKKLIVLNSLVTKEIKNAIVYGKELKTVAQ